MEKLTEVKFYYDYKSPFAYLAFEPARALEQSHHVCLRFIPHEIDIRRTLGGELHERPERAWRKVRYVYLDARRFANERGLIIRGPQKIFDSRLALISGLYADKDGKFCPYSARVFEGFFRRELDIEDPAALERVMGEVGLEAKDFRRYAASEGANDLARAFAEGDGDKIFGVPTLVVDGEPFWGYDRLDWVVKRLDAQGLRRFKKLTTV